MLLGAPPPRKGPFGFASGAMHASRRSASIAVVSVHARGVDAGTRWSGDVAKSVLERPRPPRLHPLPAPVRA